MPQKGCIARQRKLTPHLNSEVPLPQRWLTVTLAVAWRGVRPWREAGTESWEAVTVIHGSGDKSYRIIASEYVISYIDTEFQSSQSTFKHVT